LAKGLSTNTKVDGETPCEDVSKCVFVDARFIVDDAEVNVKAFCRNVGEGVMDDGDGVVRSSPTPLG
jgi:hypothetical protein